MILLALMLLACQPGTLEGCAKISNEAAREECRYSLALQAVLPDGADGDVDAAALKKTLAAIDDPLSRDLLLLRLAIAAPTEGARLCMQVSTEGAKQKCQQVLGRPHLGTTRKAPEPPPVRPGAGPGPEAGP